jgi:hypothetical protein
MVVIDPDCSRHEAMRCVEPYRVLLRFGSATRCLRLRAKGLARVRARSDEFACQTRGNRARRPVRSSDAIGFFKAGEEVAVTAEVTPIVAASVTS